MRSTRWRWPWPEGREVDIVAIPTKGCGERLADMELSMNYVSIETALASGAQFRCGPIGMRRSRGDKLLFYGDDPAWPHLTMYQRGDTGEFDLHLTKRGVGGQEEHTPILRVTPDGLRRAIIEVAKPALRILLGALRNLEIDFLVRRGIVVVAGLYPQGAAIDELWSWRDRTTLELDERKLRHRVQMIEDPAELLAAPDGVYDLREVHGRRSRSIGVAIKVRDAAGRRRMVWLKRQRWFDALKELEGLYLCALTRHASFMGEMWPASVNKLSSQML
jgi:hypothetical protein